MKLLIFLLLITIFKNISNLKEEKKEFKDFKLTDTDYDRGDLDEEDLERYRKYKIIDFDTFEKKNEILNEASMRVKNTGSYSLYSDQTIIWLFNSEGKSILSIEERGKIYLVKNDIIYAGFLYFGDSDKFRIDIQYLNQKYNLPFDPINIIDESKFDKSSISKDPLKPAEIKYKKRTGNYLYINSNNPENIDYSDLNKALIRLDISNKEVFFTFEHNLGAITTKVFSGFQIRNTGTENLKVTIKNIGFQYNGQGDWLGQKEWIDFYNMKFKVKNKDKWDDKQMKQFIALMNYSDDYEPTLFSTRTYSIPAGKYFYAIGGTSQDAYDNYNIFNTADIDVKKSVINGVVLFEVKGEAEGAFFLYNNSNIPKTDTKSYQGYVSKRNGENKVGAQYIGYDNCNGVIDNSMTWEFNDLTENQDLPVYYKVYYSESAPVKENPYTKLITKEHTINSRKWVTHHNPHKFISENSTGEVSDVRAVGTDMTNFITINEKGEQIIIDNEHYDGRGLLSNLGNWMIDYIDNFNFVNRGDKKRTISVLMGHGRQGSLACFVRNSKLQIIEGTETYTVYISESNSTLHTDDAIRDIFNYTFTVNPHSVVQIYVEYNLLANSVGNVTHSIYLGDGEEISEDSGIQMINISIYLLLFLFGMIII